MNDVFNARGVSLRKISVTTTKRKDDRGNNSKIKLALSKSINSFSTQGLHRNKLHTGLFKGNIGRHKKGLMQIYIIPSSSPENLLFLKAGIASYATPKHIL